MKIKPPPPPARQNTKPAPPVTKPLPPPTGEPPASKPAPPATILKVGSPIALRRLEERKRIFGEVEHEVWDKSSKGFVSIPRVMPLMMVLAAQLHSKAKGNAGKVYLDLWARSFDAGFLKIADEDSAAYSSGYTGERGLRTWRDHMKELSGNGFIRVAASGNKQYAYVLLINPYLVVARKLASRELADDAWIGAFVARCAEVGVDLPPELEAELARYHESRTP